MEREGSLITNGDRLVNWESAINEAANRFGEPTRIFADTHRKSELMMALEATSLSHLLMIRGMQLRYMTTILAAFRDAVVSGKIAALPTTAIRASLGWARTKVDANGRESLGSRDSGKKRRHRDDIIQAMLLAVAEGQALVLERSRGDGIHFSND